MAEHLNRFYKEDEKASIFGQEYVSTVVNIEKALHDYTVISFFPAKFLLPYF